MATHLSSSRWRDERPHRPKPIGRSPYEIVTARIIEALEDGVVPWRKPWHENPNLPCNAVSHRQYHGVNLFLLSMARYRDHRWLTYRQADELGGHVRQGEQSSIAVFWKQWELGGDDDETVEASRKRIPLLRFYHLFNVAQCEGLALPELDVTPRPRHERIGSAEELARTMPNPPRILEGSKAASYRSSTDVVEIPALDDFETPDAFYATLFHELGHATGHEKRLNRPGITDTPRFGTNGYSREELVAELVSAFCCAAIGLDNSLIDNAAGYIQGWLTTLKADAKAIVTASAQAQRGADYLQGRSLPENPSGSMPQEAMA